MTADDFGTLARIEATRAAMAARLKVSLPAKSTRITIDCRTGERTVEAVDYVPPPPRPKHRPGRIHAPRNKAYDAAVTAVCACWSVDADAVMGKSTAPCSAKFAVYRILRRAAGLSVADVGRVTGKNHSTILSGLAKARDHHEGNTTWAHRYSDAVDMYWRILRREVEQ